MQKSLSLVFSLSCCTLGNFLLVNSAIAQEITPDGTTDTQVTPDGNGNFTINRGDRAGNNLFHSFDNFSIPTNGSASFNNATDITNIFSRVTGGNLSNIDGLIEANGAANLFLVNPAGIMFGSNARLNIGGSFLGTTADSILFEDGTFSAVDLDNPPLLTINAPIGLNFRDNPAPIDNQSTASADFAPEELSFDDDLFGLRVPDGKTFALAGGDITTDTGGLVAVGGRIELGAVAESGRLGLTLTDDEISFSFPEDLSRANVSLTNNAGFLVQGNEGGDIAITANNIEILEGSGLFAGIFSGLGSTNAQAGDITFNALETLTVVNSRIHNIVNNQAVGNSGDIFIRASQVEVLETFNADVDVDSGNFLNNGIFSSVDLEGTGNAGNISIESQRLNISGNGARISTATLGEGNAGNLTIQTEQLSVLNGAQIGATNFGIGNAGVFVINASESIEVSGRGDFPSGLFSNVIEESENSNVGSLSIETKNLSVGSNGRLSASSFGTGEGGDLTINVEKLIVENGGQLQAVAFSDGSAGDLTINASNSIELRGATEEVRTGLFTSAIDSNENGGSGDGGNLTIFTDKLIIEDGATASVSNFQSLNLVPPGQGAAGNLEINANLIELNNGTISAANANGVGGGLEINANSVNIDNGSSINALTTSDTGQGGIINLNLENNLILQNNSEISAQAFNEATGGNLIIDTNFIIAFPDGNNDIIANAQQGEGGMININAESILGIIERPLNDLTNDINASSEDSTLDGDIVINTSDINPIQGTTELPINPVDLDRRIVQACGGNQNIETANSLVVNGRGGIPASPVAPLTSESTTFEGQSAANSQPNAIATSKGYITPARGVVKTKDGRIVLTAHPTTNDLRSPKGLRNCNDV